MTFKNFAKWCNDRSADGRWSMIDAMICCKVCEKVYSIKPRFFKNKKREQYWENLADKVILEECVKRINEYYKIDFP